ncbi:MAG: hypothetical protein V4627_19700 [Pseudomonadota bacterium]
MRIQAYVLRCGLAMLLGGAVVLPAHAIWGLLGKVGSGASKAAGVAGKGAAGAAGKGAATGGAAVAGAELATEGALVAKTGAATSTVADDLARASGLGKAVPDDIAAMALGSGKTLAEVPDLGARAWLATPTKQLGRADADLMVHDYVRLLEGKAAKGRPVQPAVTPAPVAKLPSTKPSAEVPWYAVELLVRAVHLGHKGAQAELDRLCAGAVSPTTISAQCKSQGSRTPAPRPNRQP